MPGWATTKQKIWETLHTAPPKSYAAAQAHHATILKVGCHVDVGELLAVLNTIMVPLKEKADQEAKIASINANEQGESPGPINSTNPRLLLTQLPECHVRQEPGELDPELSPFLTSKPDSADVAEQSHVPLPDVVYPAYVSYAIKRVLGALSQVPCVEVRAFGSAVSGFGDETSDLDLVVIATRRSLVMGLELEGRTDRCDLVPRSLAQLHKRLQAHGFHIHELVLGAQVPILKLSFNSGSSDRSRDIECDLSVNNLLPVFNTALLKAYADIDRRAVEVTQACKHWAKVQGVHGASLGHLSSYAFTLMVIFYMQVKGALPCLQDRSQEDPLIYKEEGKEYNVAIAGRANMAWVPAQKVAISFSGFVRFFCQEFKWGDWVVSIRKGQCFSKEDYPRLRMRPKKGITLQEWDTILHIEDPFDIERNLNCVMSPTHSEKLRLALRKQNRLALLKKNSLVKRTNGN